MIESIKKSNNNDLAESIKKFGEKYTAGMDFILDSFLSLDESEVERMYSHSTMAIDTENIKIVWNSVTDIFLRKHFENSGY